MPVPRSITARCALAVSLSLFAAPSAFGQACGQGTTLFKNDLLPVNPGSAAVSVIRGLCEGEAIGAVYDVSSIGSQVQLKRTGVGFFNVAGASGTVGVVNLLVYDGITWNAGIPTLGPLVFDWATQTGTSIQVTSHGINTIDVSQQNIVVSSGTLVVTWRMDINLNGNCAAGYTSNFGTDHGGGAGGCPVPEQNLIFIQGQGWRDPGTAQVLGIPLCPLFYDGNWVMRECVEAVNKTSVYCTAKTNSLGCVPSIDGIGIPSVAATSGYTIAAANIRNAKAGLLFYSLSGRASLPFQGGTLCVSLPVRRTPVVNSGGNPPPFVDCSGVYSLDFLTFASGGLGGSPHAALQVAGTQVNAQFWGRDPGFPQPQNTHLTDGVEFTLEP